MAHGFLDRDCRAKPGDDTAKDGAFGAVITS
jgi:hypothetical protein